MAASKLGKIAIESSALFLCDMQEGFRKTISYYPQILEVSRRMLEGAKALDMPIVVTEQYPKGRSIGIAIETSSADPHLYDDINLVKDNSKELRGRPRCY